MRTSSDPYSDFVVRIMNSCRIAEGQSGSMSEREYRSVKAIQARMLECDPFADVVDRASVIIRKKKVRVPV